MAKARNTRKVNEAVPMTFGLAERTKIVTVKPRKPIYVVFKGKTVAKVGTLKEGRKLGMDLDEKTPDQDYVIYLFKSKPTSRSKPVEIVDYSRIKKRYIASRMIGTKLASNYVRKDGTLGNKVKW